MILDAKNDRMEWLKIILSMPEEYQDIYFHPDYVALNCFKQNSDGYLFYNEDYGKIWINPFIKIKVPELIKENKNIYFDLETPYGYGGPISNTTDQEFIIESNQKFINWVKENNIIAEFVRLHPLYNSTNFTDSKIQILENRVTCSLNLNLLTNDLSPFKSKVKNMLRSASKNTYAVISKDKKDFNEFKKIYINLMIEKDAEKENFFSKSYFDNLFTLIKNNGFMSVIRSKNSEILAIGVFLNGKNSCHYHLSASKNHKLPGVNNYLIYNAALYAKKKNLQILHLGGGNQNIQNDNLFKFKNTMSTNNHKYYIGKRINNIKIYNELKNAWKKKYPILSKKYSNRLLCYHVNTEIIDTNLYY